MKALLSFTFWILSSLLLSGIETWPPSYSDQIITDIHYLRNYLYGCHAIVLLLFFILFSCFWYGPWYLFPTLPLCMCKQFFVCLIVPSWSILIGWKKIMANSFQSLKKKKKRGVKLIVISKGQISLVKWFYSDVPSFHLKYRVGGWKSDEIKNILGY